MAEPRPDRSFTSKHGSKLVAVAAFVVLGAPFVGLNDAVTQSAANQGGANESAADGAVVEVPDTWAVEWLPYVEFVETTRGLAFEYPVNIERVSIADALVADREAEEGDADWVEARWEQQLSASDSATIAAEYAEMNAETAAIAPGDPYIENMLAPLVVLNWMLFKHLEAVVDDEVARCAARAQAIVQPVDDFPAWEQVEAAAPAAIEACQTE